MTQPTPGRQPAELPPNLTAAVAIDESDPQNPVVVLRLSNAGISAEFRIEATKAMNFAAVVAQAMIGAAQQALARRGPQIVTPNGPGRTLFVAGDAPLPPMPPRGRSNGGPL